jgi:hypothetical protein
MTAARIEALQPAGRGTADRLAAAAITGESR